MLMNPIHMCHRLSHYSYCVVPSMFPTTNEYPMRRVALFKMSVHGVSTWLC